MSVLVTFVPDYLPSGTGFAQAFYHLHRSILDNGLCDRVYVFAATENSSCDKEEIQVYNIGKYRGLRLFESNATRWYAKLYFEKKLKKYFSILDNINSTKKIQMILVESMFMAWVIPLLKKKYPSIPIVTRIHGCGPEYTAYYKVKKDTKYNEYLLDTVFSNSNIAVTTEFYIRFFNDLYHDYAKFIDKELFIVPNTTKIDFDCLKKDKKERLQLLQLGRMNVTGYHQKGFQDTIKALLYIEEIRPDIANKIDFVSIGNGELKNDFLNKCSNFRYIKHKHYDQLPNDEVKKIEQEADVILLPSRTEGMSMFATEVLAIGKPILNTFHNGLDCVCINNENSLGMEYYDYLQLAENIIRLADNPDLRVEFGNNSKQLFEQEYSYDAVAKKYSVMLRTLEKEK